MKQPLTQKLMYPLAEFDGTMKSIDWSSLPHLPANAPTGRGETQSVFPETFSSTRRRRRSLTTRASTLPAHASTVRIAIRSRSRRTRHRPVHGFWSLTMYNTEHFFVPNEIGRYSVGTKNKELQFARDGSLTIYVQSDAPPDPHQRANWLPAPKNEDFSLFIRAYWPQTPVTDGSWTHRSTSHEV